MTAALKTVQVGQDHTPGASKLSASRAVSCLPADLADFLHSHRPHSAPTADATAPAWNGYLLTLACPCAVVFGDGSRHKTPSLICSVSPLSTEAEDASLARRRTVDTPRMPSLVGCPNHCCFGVSLGVVSLGVVGAVGSFCRRVNLVSTLMPSSCSRYIATTIVPSTIVPS